MIVRKTLLISVFLMVFEDIDTSVLVADHRMSRMVELSAKAPYCKVHSDR